MVYKINNLNDIENIKDIDDEAKALLNECGVPRDEIRVIPVIQPISSYAYEINDEYREKVSGFFS